MKGINGRHGFINQLAVPGTNFKASEEPDGDQPEQKLP
jgi:hypothetical protein